MRIPWLLAVLAGCSFEIRAAPDPDHGIDAGIDGRLIDGSGMETGIDAPDPVIGDVAHVAQAVEQMFDATGHLVIVNATINTRSGIIDPTIDVPLPPGTTLTYAAQEGGGPALAILMVRSLEVTGTLRVRGDRALVIIARTHMMITGVIDGNAEAATAGPGGYQLGVGRGGAGQSGSSFADSGGGGGGFGGPGAAGQRAGSAASGTSGPAYGTSALTRLEGGSGGGALAPACTGHPAGAGGGAIQLHAGGTITLAGLVMVNGGGGAGGLVCPVIDLGTGGAGGGAGGAIYVQAAAITGNGRLLAQGGGGGGASNYNNDTAGAAGQPGSTAIQAAAGGTGAGTGIQGESNDGGAGGFRDAGPVALTNLSGMNFGNGGGGGGGVGRIVIRAPSISGVQASPLAVQNP